MSEYSMGFGAGCFWGLLCGVLGRWFADWRRRQS